MGLDTGIEGEGKNFLFEKREEKKLKGSTFSGEEKGLC